MNKIFHRLVDLTEYLLVHRLLWGIALVYILISAGGQFWKPTHNPIYSDSAGYYTHLPQIFIYQDFGFSEDPQFIESYKNQNYYEPETWYLAEGRNGNSISKFPIGVAVMELPFFLTAHLFSYVLGYPTNGYSFLYKLFFIISNVSYSLLGLFIIRRVLLNWFTPFISSLGTAIIGLSTNLLFYSFVICGMSHNYSFALFAGLIYLTERYYRTRKTKALIGIGLIGGLITIIRPTNALAVLIFVLWGLEDWKGIQDRLILYMKEWKSLFYASLACVAVLFIQLIYWKWSVGTWLFYSYGEESLNLAHSHFIEGLFSFRKGWLVYTPVMILAIYGFFVMPKFKDLPVKVLAPFYFLVHAYIVFSWWSWYYGGSFGSRPMIEITALLAIPLCAALVIFSKTKQRQIILLAFLVLTTGLNIFQSYQYKAGIIHYSNMSFKAYVYAFGKIGHYSQDERVEFEKLLLLEEP